MSDQLFIALLGATIVIAWLGPCVIVCTEARRRSQSGPLSDHQSHLIRIDHPDGTVEQISPLVLKYSMTSAPINEAAHDDHFRNTLSARPNSTTKPPHQNGASL